MKIISVNNYEIGNGIEAKVEKDGKEYVAYLQLPDCGDSQHSFLSGEPDENAKELLSEIVELVESEYTATQLNLITFVGYEADYEELTYEGNRFFVINDEDRGYPVFAESPYSDYYNVLLFTDVDPEFRFDTEFLKKTHEITDKWEYPEDADED